MVATSKVTQAVTPALRRWIVEQAEAGCLPEDVVKAMIASGWHEDVAIEALEQTLRSHLETLRREGRIAARPAVDVQADTAAASLPAKPAVEAVQEALADASMPTSSSNVIGPTGKPNFTSVLSSFSTGSPSSSNCAASFI